jgi:hypothetical protein
LTKEEITTAVSDAHKVLDAALTTARHASLTIEMMTEAAIKSGYVPHLVGKKALHQAQDMTGAIAAAAHASADVHDFNHGVAVKWGTDGILQPLSVIGGVQPDGGTR